MRDIGLALNRWLNQAKLKAYRYRMLLALLLTLLVVISAQGVVYSAFQGRGLINELHQLEQGRDALKVQWGQLLLEQSAWSSHSRVERVVREQLHMQVPATEQITMVRP